MFPALAGGFFTTSATWEALGWLLENKILKVLKGEWKLIGRIRGGVPYKENRICIKAWR